MVFQTGESKNSDTQKKFFFALWRKDVETQTW
jgi:hypothetical protein